MDLVSRHYRGLDLVNGELHALASGMAAVYTATCPGADRTNEDSCALVAYDANSGVLVVADGAGGLPQGDMASGLAVAAVRRAVRRAARQGLELRTAVLDGIEAADRAVKALGVGAGTTLAIAEIKGRKVRTYHVGDSQILLVGPRGKIKLQTMSHSPVGYAIGAGLLGEEAAMHHEERHLVSNLVGFASMHIEIGGVFELAKKDTLIVASDGLFDNLTASEIAESCRKRQLLGSIHDLAERCRGRMLQPEAAAPSKPDDLTVIAFRRRSTD